MQHDNTKKKTLLAVICVKLIATILELGKAGSQHTAKNSSAIQILIL
uniref:Uncharacterized protein n=1 Tax=Anguilla anguilla TaxID=7936 RepID=A0A0E9WMM1_ANGAN